MREDGTSRQPLTRSPRAASPVRRSRDGRSTSSPFARIHQPANVRRIQHVSAKHLTLDTFRCVRASMRTIFKRRRPPASRMSRSRCGAAGDCCSGTIRLVGSDNPHASFLGRIASQSPHTTSSGCACDSAKKGHVAAGQFSAGLARARALDAVEHVRNYPSYVRMRTFGLVELLFAEAKRRHLRRRSPTTRWRQSAQTCPLDLALDGRGV